MIDVARDNRVLSLVSKSGLRNLLTTLLDQLQRCQKALNEFLEVRKNGNICSLFVYMYGLSMCFCFDFCLFVCFFFWGGRRCAFVNETNYEGVYIFTNSNCGTVEVLRLLND